jgi:hypothetical protein
LNIEHSSSILVESLLLFHLSQNSIGLSIILYGKCLIKDVFVGIPSALHNNIDDHGTRRSDTLPILAQRWHPVSSEALSIIRLAICAASSQVAAMVIKSDKDNQQNHVWNCVVLM